VVAFKKLLADNCTPSSRCGGPRWTKMLEVDEKARCGPPKKRTKKQPNKKLEVDEPSDEGPPPEGLLGWLHGLDQVQKEREAAGLPPPWWEANTWLKENEHKYLGGEADAKDGPSCSSSASASMLEKKQRLEKGGEADAKDGPNCSSKAGGHKTAAM